MCGGHGRGRRGEGGRPLPKKEDGTPTGNVNLQSCAAQRKKEFGFSGIRCRGGDSSLTSGPFIQSGTKPEWGTGRAGQHCPQSVMTTRWRGLPLPAGPASRGSPPPACGGGGSRPALAAGARHLHLADHVLPLDHGAEHGVLAVQMGARWGALGPPHTQGTSAEDSVCPNPNRTLAT